jgi:hypothetical protein
MNAFKICFKNSKYNYITSLNGTYQDAENYFLNKWFNLGVVDDNMQKCIKIED